MSLRRTVGVDGENHVEKDDLQQAVINRMLLVVAYQGAQHFRQIQPISPEIPLQIDADALMHQPDQQTITHIVALIWPVPEAAVVLLLTLLEACQTGAIAAHR